MSYNDELKKAFGENDISDEFKKIIAEAYEDMTDVNIQHALEECCGIIGMHFMHCDDDNNYERTDADCMVAIAHEIKAVLWIMVTAGNAIYKDPSDKSLEHERWHTVVNFFIMPAVWDMIMDHSLEMMYEIGAGKDVDKIKARLENMNKEFTRVRLCHPIFATIDFAKYINTCEAIMNEDDGEIKEHVDRVYRAIHDPSILDIDLIIDKILGIGEFERDYGFFCPQNNNNNSPKNEILNTGLKNSLKNRINIYIKNGNSNNYDKYRYEEEDDINHNSIEGINIRKKFNEKNFWKDRKGTSTKRNVYQNTDSFLSQIGNNIIISKSLDKNNSQNKILNPFENNENKI